MKSLFAALCLSLGVNSVAAEELPIFDAHVHYSHDAVKRTPPERIIELLKEAGVKKALVSSSDDNGTQLLYEAAPDLIVPALRPYSRRGQIGTWMNNPASIDYMKGHLANNTYVAFGEFHAFGEDINTDVIQWMIQEAKERNMLLHHHGDAEAVHLIFKTWPEARVLWAHSGFDRPEDVAEVLSQYDRLWADLAYRSDMMSRGDVDPEWRKVFMAYPCLLYTSPSPRDA